MTGVELLMVTTFLTSMTGQGGGVFLQVKNAALKDQCLLQLQQIFLAIQLRVDENDGRLPMAWFYHPTDARSIVNVVAGKDASVRKLFVCPAAPQAWQQTGLTYVYNDAIRGQLMDSLPNPSGVWLLMDANAAGTQFPPPHLGGYNVLFCDGHAKWVPAQQMGNFWRPPVVEQAPDEGGGAAPNTGGGYGEDE